VVGLHRNGITLPAAPSLPFASFVAPQDNVRD
jgi:hypothetical protein